VHFQLFADSPIRKVRKLEALTITAHSDNKAIAVAYYESASHPHAEVF
jgi:hypothetical protein